MISREAVFSALFQLAQNMTWSGGQTWVKSSRRFFMWDDADSQPAMCQISETERSTHKTGQDYFQRWHAKWFFYHNAGKDPSAIPDQVTNAILDAAYAALAPIGSNNKQTLGGLVHHCFIDGNIVKVPGDIDGQAMIVVPITILVP